MSERVLMAIATALVAFIFAGVLVSRVVGWRRLKARLVGAAGAIHANRERSTFVTAAAGVSILLSLVALLLWLAQLLGAGYALSPGQFAALTESRNVVFALAVLPYVRVVMALAAAVSATALVASVGLLLRWPPARRLYIACECLVILWLLRGVVAEAVLVAEFAATGAGGPWATPTMVLRGAGWVGSLAVCVGLGWVAARLMSDEVRQEFAR
ncbi:MAG: hypothetical protein ISS72_11230 [Candidatus Brocadiae bacterium]|nr:hypothetical protein [Candidatus Brocadiia bacterium]